MPNINLKDGRNRDARVRAESVGERATVRYVDPQGADVALHKVLRATAEHGYDKLKAAAGGEDEALARQLVAEDSDVDFERIGMFLAGASRVYLNRAGEIVYHIAETEVVRAPSGEEKERRPRKRPEPNADGEIPVSWTGRKLAKDEALRRFVFSSKLQIVHVNGLTYDFLYGMAKELHEANCLMLLGAGKSGKEPLIFTRHSTPHRGFLEGRIAGDRYVLLLHLSKMELKRPAVVETVAVVQAAVQPVMATVVRVKPMAPQPAAVMPEVVVLIAPPADVGPLPVAAVGEPKISARMAMASKMRKPTVREVIAATTAVGRSTGTETSGTETSGAKTTGPETAGTQTAGAKPEIAEALSVGKAAKSRRGTSATAGGEPKTPASKRATKPKPSAAP